VFLCLVQAFFSKKILHRRSRKKCMCESPVGPDVHELPLGPNVCELPAKPTCPICQQSTELRGITLCCKQKTCTKCVVKQIIHKQTCSLCSQNSRDYIACMPSMIEVTYYGSLLCSWKLVGNPSIVEVKRMIEQKTGRWMEHYDLVYKDKVLPNEGHIFEFGGIFTTMQVKLCFRFPTNIASV
jgi:hypothetical protein